MGKVNIAYIYGRVSKKPIVQIDKDTGEYVYGMVYLDTVRSLRPIEDDVRYVKHDHPLIISREKEILDNMRNWDENDMIFVKGVISTKMIPKSSFCPECQDEAGNPTKNIIKGNLIYITPIYAEKVKSFEDKMEAIDDLIQNREISNQIYVLGTLIHDPQFFTTKRGLRICQYQLALDRKFKIRTDDLSIKADWPVVKTYGDMACDDKLHLTEGSVIIADGFLQARTVTRHIKCAHCGKIYDFKDHSMEIVPYAVEYVEKCKETAEIEAEGNGRSVEQQKQILYNSGIRDEAPEGIAASDDMTS